MLKKYFEKLSSRLLIGCINFYQIFFSFDKGIFMVFAPGGSCKFSISCSEYTKQMIKKHGAIQGIILGVKRLIICK